MTTMTIQVLEALEKEHNETVRLIAAKLYEAGKLNLRQAAEMCQMKKWDFAEILIPDEAYAFSSTTGLLQSKRVQHVGYNILKLDFFISQAGRLR
ncbi:hypothetical protein EZJ43_08310 [Pedobacter changchengzhani]|uniref:Uncharacterized protein n=1 Tax=Pedobacter changchengzhani TaxID=2529274 RepID=A0A4R5MN50_9SPHI|nr:UPF0175 family protein [Pedobacter changchengzhani]TDG36509.1 hypothetical protein EZJ43_08310 [Pedobacter changchengzhani]